jgi:ABC-type transport system involved in cytochrome bd biosynthesis fused ATPase/permease subunit
LLFFFCNRNHGIKDYLKDKVILMSTNAIEYCNDVDYIYYMETSNTTTAATTTTAAAAAATTTTAAAAAAATATAAATADNNNEHKEEEINEEVIAGKDEHSVSLINVSLELKEKQIGLIIGSVGSGKSTLLSALLGECPSVSLKKEPLIVGSVAYVSQVPFIAQDTIRNNILFGRKFNNQLYNKILHICT